MLNAFFCERKSASDSPSKNIKRHAIKHYKVQPQKNADIHACQKGKKTLFKKQQIKWKTTTEKFGWCCVTIGERKL